MGNKNKTYKRNPYPTVKIGDVIQIDFADIEHLVIGVVVEVDRDHGDNHRCLFSSGEVYSTNTAHYRKSGANVIDLLYMLESINQSFA